ncbi:MAG TPA: ABC-2 family transporter protein [Actinoplanes sp.]|nr:ABC-2 family transporter protein [Actinoplanes sp.]
MRPYLALVRATVRTTLAYRMNFVMSLFGLLFQLLALLAIWHAVIGAGQVEGLTWPQMKTYLLVAFGTGAVVSLYADFRMAYRIQSGMVSVDLVRPVDYQTARFAETLGWVWIELVAVAVTWGLAIAFTGPTVLPPAGQLALFAVSFAVVVPLKFLIVYVSGLTCFWTQNYMGVNWMRIAVVNLLSGALVPLAFFPGWLRTAAELSPFAGMTSTPALIAIGELRGAAAWQAIAVQLVWVAVLWVGARAAWRRAVRQLTVHGG